MREVVLDALHLAFEEVLGNAAASSLSIDWRLA